MVGFMALLADGKDELLISRHAGGDDPTAGGDHGSGEELVADLQAPVDASGGRNRPELSVDGGHEHVAEGIDGGVLQD